VEGPSGPRPSPPRGHGEGMTVRGSFGSRRDTGWDHREMDRHDPEAAVTAGRIARPDAAGSCRRTEQRELPRASAPAPTSGWCDGQEPNRTSLVEDGTVRIDGGTRSDATDGGPNWRGILRDRDPGVGAYSRGAHPPATPRWARKGARGVRASRGTTRGKSRAPPERHRSGSVGRTHPSRLADLRSAPTDRGRRA